MKKLEIHTLGLLFEEVQLKNILTDGKTFPDCIPKDDLEKINLRYHQQKGSAGLHTAKIRFRKFRFTKSILNRLQKQC